MGDVVCASVVVVDDDVNITRILKSMIGLEGHTVEACGSGVELMRVLDRVTPDLVFLDLNLPERSGLQLLRDLRSRYDDRVDVVILSGDDARDTGFTACLAAGAADYLLKPVRLERVLATVRTSLTARNLRRARDAHASSLRLTRAMLETTLALVREPFVIVDNERRITSWSGAANELVPTLAGGITLNELSARSGAAIEIDEHPFEGGAVLRLHLARRESGSTDL